MLEEILDKLSQPLAAEAQLGYDNSAVPGGLDGYMMAQSWSALEAIERGDLPPYAEYPPEPEPPAPPRRDPQAAGMAAAPPRTAKEAKEADAIDSELTYLKGVGPKRAEALARLGLRTVYDLLYYFPFRYEDRRQVKH